MNTGYETNTDRHTVKHEKTQNTYCETELNTDCAMLRYADTHTESKT